LVVRQLNANIKKTVTQAPQRHVFDPSLSPVRAKFIWTATLVVYSSAYNAMSSVCNGFASKWSEVRRWGTCQTTHVKICQLILN